MMRILHTAIRVGGPPKVLGYSGYCKPQNEGARIFSGSVLPKPTPPSNSGLIGTQEDPKSCQSL